MGTHLPFSEADFLQLLDTFNRSTWPVVAGLWLVSAWTAVQLARGRANPRALMLLLSVHWLWSGLAYHALLFSRINPAAPLFAGLFVAQGLLYLHAWIRGGPAFSWEPSLRQITGLALIAASLVYPLLVLLDGHRYPAAPAFGLPCPTTLFTAGVLLCATSPVPRRLLVGPIAWSLVGGSAAFLLGMRPDLLLFISGAGLAVLLLPRAVLHRIECWWTPAPEAHHQMRGDTVAIHPAFDMTLTRVAHARPEQVWPWLVQLGYQRGGLYSYDWLDRLFGYLDAPSATSILPQFQQLHEGDVIPMGHGAGFPVRMLEENRSLVLGGEQEKTRWSWEIELVPVDESHTRITSRSRGDVPHTFAARLFIALLGPAAFLMTRRMLLGLAWRAETLARTR